MKYRSKTGIVHWKHLRLHKYRPKSSGIWPPKTKKVHASLSNRKDSRYSTASCNKFYDSVTNANTKARQDNNVVVTDHSKPNSACQSIGQENKPLSQCFLSEALRLFHKCEKRMLQLLITKQERFGYLLQNPEKAMHTHLASQKLLTPHALYNKVVRCLLYQVLRQPHQC